MLLVGRVGDEIGQTRREQELPSAAGMWMHVADVLLQGHTALMWAANNGKCNSLSALLQAGAEKAGTSRTRHG